MHCEKCGKENQTETNYCKNCGNQLIIKVASNTVGQIEKKEKITKRSTYFIHVVIAIVLIMFTKYYEANNDSSSLSEDLEALFNITSFVYLIVVGYKFFFYKKYIAGLNASAIDNKRKS